MWKKYKLSQNSDNQCVCEKENRPTMRLHRGLVTSVVGAFLLQAACIGANAQLDDIIKGRSLGGQIVKGVAIGYAVKQSSRQLNSFINTVTLRNHVPQNLSTKVVPILSVGERGYIGGAQVAGPKALVDKTQAVWQYEEGFNRGEYRIKALVPSSSLNPIEIKRVPKVGLSALIDVSLGGGFSSNTRSGPVGTTRVLRAAVVAGAVVAAAKPLNQFINTVTFNKDPMTRVVPQASFGETAYIGGAQVTGSSRTANSVKAVFEYWDSFDKGRYRIRALVPVNGVDPTKIRRVEGAGVLALIDTSIAEQKKTSSRPNPMGSRLGSFVIGDPRPKRDEDENEDARIYRHDNGLHLGWYKNGKWNGEKEREKARKHEEHEKEKRDKRHRDDD